MKVSFSQSHLVTEDEREAYATEGVTVGEGVFLAGDFELERGVVLEEGVKIYALSLQEEPLSLHIRAGTRIGAGTEIYCGDISMQDQYRIPRESEIGYNTKIAPGVKIELPVFIGNEACIQSGAHIFADVYIGPSAKVGPRAVLLEGTHLEAGSCIPVGAEIYGVRIHNKRLLAPCEEVTT